MINYWILNVSIELFVSFSSPVDTHFKILSHTTFIRYFYPCSPYHSTELALKLHIFKPMTHSIARLWVVFLLYYLHRTHIIILCNTMRALPAHNGCSVNDKLGQKYYTKFAMLFNLDKETSLPSLQMLFRETASNSYYPYVKTYDIYIK